MSSSKKKQEEIVQPHFEVNLTQINFLIGCRHKILILWLCQNLKIYTSSLWQVSVIDP